MPVVVQEEVDHTQKVPDVAVLNVSTNLKDKVHHQPTNQVHSNKAVTLGVTKLVHAVVVAVVDQDVVTSKEAVVPVAAVVVAVDQDVATSATEIKTMIHNKKAADGNKVPSM